MKVESELSKLKELVITLIDKSKYNEALKVSSLYALLCYEYNQFYSDKEL